MFYYCSIVLLFAVVLFLIVFFRFYFPFALSLSSFLTLLLFYYSSSHLSSTLITPDSTFPHSTSGFYHKRVVLDGLGCYWSMKMNKNDLISHVNKNDWRRKMYETLQKIHSKDESRQRTDSNKTTQYRHVIPPCTVQCQSVEAHGYDDQTEMPKFDISLSTKSLEICLIEATLRDTGAIAEITNDQYFRRPRRRPSDGPLRRAWWRYAIRQVR